MEQEEEQKEEQLFKEIVQHLHLLPIDVCHEIADYLELSDFQITGWTPIVGRKHAYHLTRVLFGYQNLPDILPTRIQALYLLTYEKQRQTFQLGTRFQNCKTLDITFSNFICESMPLLQSLHLKHVEILKGPWEEKPMLYLKRIYIEDEDDERLGRLLLHFQSFAAHLPRLERVFVIRTAIELDPLTSFVATFFKERMRARGALALR